MAIGIPRGLREMLRGRVARAEEETLIAPEDVPGVYTVDYAAATARPATTTSTASTESFTNVPPVEDLMRDVRLSSAQEYSRVDREFINESLLYPRNGTLEFRQTGDIETRDYYIEGSTTGDNVDSIFGLEMNVPNSIYVLLRLMMKTPGLINTNKLRELGDIEGCIHHLNCNLQEVGSNTHPSRYRGMKWVGMPSLRDKERAEYLLSLFRSSKMTSENEQECAFDFLLEEEPDND